MGSSVMVVCGQKHVMADNLRQRNKMSGIAIELKGIGKGTNKSTLCLILKARFK